MKLIELAETYSTTSLLSTKPLFLRKQQIGLEGKQLIDGNNFNFSKNTLNKWLRYLLIIDIDNRANHQKSMNAGVFVKTS